MGLSSPGGGRGLPTASAGRHIHQIDRHVFRSASLAKLREATAHARAGSNKPLYLGHPEFEGFTVLQEEKADGSRMDAAE